MAENNRKDKKAAEKPRSSPISWLSRSSVQSSRSN